VTTDHTLVPPRFEANGAPLLTGVRPGDVAENIIIAVRDPLGFDEDAAWQISRKMHDVRLIADTGMFITLTGTYQGVPVTVCSTGSGAPDTEIAFAELAEAAGGRPTILRVGTSGSAHQAVEVGDLIITTAAVRSEGTTAAYVPAEYPAVADHFLVESLRQAALDRGSKHHLGITRSTDSIYAGQGREVLGFSAPGLERIPGFWAGVNVLNYERETSLILTLGNIFGYRVGSVCSVVNSAVSGDLDAGAGVDAAIMVGLEGLAKLAKAVE
jgi:uridine phosphorylase